MSSRVWVFGSYITDVRAVAERHPRVGETVLGSDFATGPGGKGANQAVAAARAGASVSMVGRVGDDPYGQALLAFHEAEGIDISHCRAVPDVATGTALITVAGGDNTIVVVPGANLWLQPEAADAIEFAPEDLVVAQFETPEATTRRAFARAREVGARTILNPAPAAPADEELLGLTDILVLNETELAELHGSVDVHHLVDDTVLHEAAFTLAGESGQALIVTLGERGALVIDPAGTHQVEGHPVQALDSTGAGDCFVGNLAARLSHGHGVRAAAEWANHAAALCVQRLGTGPAMPRAEETLLFST